MIYSTNILSAYKSQEAKLGAERDKDESNKDTCLQGALLVKWLSLIHSKILN